jgi:hypothetical protein
VRARIPAVIIVVKSLIWKEAGGLNVPLGSGTALRPGSRAPRRKPMLSAQNGIRNEKRESHSRSEHRRVGV